MTLSAGGSARGDDGADGSADAQLVTSQQIEELIRQLGHPRFTVRRSSANELRQIGPEAFDQLDVATDDPDPEIAASARYLLQQISVRWTRPDDSAAARRYLNHYGDQSLEQRLLRVEALSRLPDDEGLAGLCRIARFERSPLLSRFAALAVIWPPDRDESDTAPAPETIETELGASSRTAASWLRQYAEQLRDPTAALVVWQRLIADEAELLDRNLDDTKPEIYLGLLWNLVDIRRQLGQGDQVMEVIDQMLTLEGINFEETATDLVQWMLLHESWDGLDRFLNEYNDRLEHAKRPLYVAALARSRQGRDEQAELLAEKASQLNPMEPLESIEMARELAVLEQFEWSVREYHNAIDSRPVKSHESLLGRVFLSSMLHDHQHFQEAAETIEPLAKGIEEDEETKGFYKQIKHYHDQRGDVYLPELKALKARYNFYLACLYDQLGKWSKQREHLRIAIDSDPLDADVLIAMYHGKNADDQWGEMVQERIDDLCRQFQQEIDENPNDPTPYNQWAWLVSNTEGDYAKAVRYSHRSLELMPGTSSFLDTLGRCYFSTGDFDSAVKYQREAVENLPHLQVMHRQLAEFERALAERQAEAIGADN